jgi:hypothetical protein
MVHTVAAISQDSLAQLFLKYDYAETKDLAKHFLTIVVSILVFSLTFSEKIADFRNATRWTQRLLVASWCLMLLSILACGLGLVANSVAGGQAVYGGTYRRLAGYGYLLIITAGATLIAGLMSLTLAAILSTRVSASSVQASP